MRQAKRRNFSPDLKARVALRAHGSRPTISAGNHASARCDLSGFVVDHHECIDLEELGNGAELRLEAGHELVVENARASASLSQR